MNIAHFEQMSSYIPVDLTSLEGILKSNIVILFFIVTRYLIAIFFVYYLFWKKHLKLKLFPLVHDQDIPSGQVYQEIRWSILSSILFMISGYTLGLLWQLGWSQIYLSLDSYPLWYLPISFLLYAAIHEIYFYASHAWMHRPAIYRKIHYVHHESRKVSPWASFSFHPGEAFFHAIFLPIMILIVPIHPLVLLFYLAFMTITAVSNHSGVEFVPIPIVRRFFISGTHHSIHHQKFHYNYGLYSTFLDRLFKTEFMPQEKL